MKENNFVLSHEHTDFRGALNALINRGWLIVPNSFYYKISQTESESNAVIYGKSAYKETYFIALEKERKM